MGNNVLSAIVNISKFKNSDIKEYSSHYLIRINTTGEQLEFYVKDAIADCFKKKQSEKEAEYRRTFSYLGNQNNPPDMIIKKGDAFEIKKIENQTSSLALNSSPPKDKLHVSDPRLTEACKKCETWSEKDLFYVVGYVAGKKLRYLLFIHGMCYAADKSVYEKTSDPMKKEIDNIIRSQGLQAGTTQELGRINRVDPLGITELRVRGMWQIQNPTKLFSNLFTINTSKEFSLVAIIQKDKYTSFPKEDVNLIENTKGINIVNIKIKDPNNPAKEIDAKMIRLEW